MSTDLSRLADLVDAFSRQTIVVLGDLVADEFVFGEISRVSREAPVLILRHRETQLVPGGGANAANNLADLGAKVRPVVYRSISAWTCSVFCGLTTASGRASCTEESEPYT